MEPTGRLEVWASENALLSFDGRVLEVFGFADTHRFHVAFTPVVLVGKRMVTIRPTHGGQYSFFYDQPRRGELEAFAAHVNALHP
ncbi:hypothetical protein [Nocardioides plantarum]|uniref:Uncharacterized protein n=1 Tax=Nocardioides plantarum TaxID=29299 RepID=A0ABV5KFS9_9ACTN|nr:hypothetical protein [Nocardioides plantarum]